MEHSIFPISKSLRKPPCPILSYFSKSPKPKCNKKFQLEFGRGGFGYVFEGTLLDSTIIAAKKLENINQREKFEQKLACLVLTNMLILFGFVGFALKVA